MVRTDMSRTARLFQLMQSLRTLPPPATAELLAETVAVSVRTIYRDVDTLRGLGAVIDGEAGFGFTLIEDATLPPLGFENEELEALVLGLREVQAVGDPSLAKAAGSALSKLKGRLPARQAHRLQHAVLDARRYCKPPPPTIDVKTLRAAAWDEVAVSFSYTDVHGSPSSRSANPLGIVYLDQSHVLLAWCHLRCDFRVFRLDRMLDLHVTGESFRPKRVALLREHLARIRAEDAQSAKDRTVPD